MLATSLSSLVLGMEIEAVGIEAAGCDGVRKGLAGTGALHGAGQA